MATKINKLRAAMLEHPELSAGIRLSNRERYLMLAALKAFGIEDPDLEGWLNSRIDSCGHTVEQVLNYCAEEAQT